MSESIAELEELPYAGIHDHVEWVVIQPGVDQDTERESTLTWKTENETEYSKRDRKIVEDRKRKQMNESVVVREMTP